MIGTLHRPRGAGAIAIDRIGHRDIDVVIASWVGVFDGVRECRAQLWLLLFAVAIIVCVTDDFSRRLVGRGDCCLEGCGATGAV